jgi:hypothetical protein
MEEQLVEVLEQLIEGRNSILPRMGRIVNARNRPAIMSRFLMNEVLYIELLNRVLQSHVRNQLATTVLTITLPQTLTGSNFTDPVLVVPTQEQIDNALEDIESSTTDCAICQDSISSGGCRIRSCQHVYHRSCLLDWFAMNVRCPVCRHDIREDQVTQTPPASE